MDGFKAVILSAYDIMQLHFNLLGYDVTLWQCFLFFALAGAVMALFFGTME